MMEEKNGAESAAVSSFESKISDAISGCWMTMGLATGKQLGLFEAMCKFDELATSQEIADISGCKERYIREWLLLMTSCGVVNIGDDGKCFILPHEHRACLDDPDSPVLIAPNGPLVMYGYPQVIEAFKKEGPAGIDAVIGEPALSYQLTIQDMDSNIQALLDQVPPDLIKELEDGIDCCDFGGGRGLLSISMAKRFPYSRFTNVDLSNDALREGEQQAKQLGIGNVSFMEQDATRLPEDWSHKFDYIVTFHALHDFPAPASALREMYRSLKPGGTASVIDVMVDSDPRLTVKNEGCAEDSRMLYAGSLYHCLPLSLAQKDSVGHGACIGRQIQKQLVIDAGYEVVREFNLTSHHHLLLRK